MSEYTLSKINRLGDPDPTYGQTWYGEVHEDLKPVMFNVLEGEFEAGDKIEYEVSENKRSKKGVDYLRLKKVKKVGSMLEKPSEASQVAQNEPGQLDRIEANQQEILSKLDQLLGL